jgi:hypothetical protein
MWLERAYGDEEDDQALDKGKGKGKDEPREKTPEPTIGAELLVSSCFALRIIMNYNASSEQELMGLIFSASLMQAALSEMNYDANKVNNTLGSLLSGILTSCPCISCPWESLPNRPSSTVLPLSKALLKLSLNQTAPKLPSTADSVRHALL